MLCHTCPFGKCFEDRRENPVPGRKTQFRIAQQAAIHCTFSDFVPGFDGDPNPHSDLNTYRQKFRDNILRAGELLVGDDFDVKSDAFAKVEGDIGEIIGSAVLWNAAAVWNHYMDTGQWSSNALQQPSGIQAVPAQKVAIVKLPRRYDATRLFSPTARARITQFEEDLKSRGMSLGLSAPDIIGVRLPFSNHPDTAGKSSAITGDQATNVRRVFAEPILNLSRPNLNLLEKAYQRIEGTIGQNDLLFAIAIKVSLRSDRLYQPLFEANVLKYLLHAVLQASRFKFYVHAWSIDGCDAKGHYEAASIYSLMRGGNPERAVDQLDLITHPVITAQNILNDLLSLTDLDTI